MPPGRSRFDFLGMARNPLIEGKDLAVYTRAHEIQEIFSNEPSQRFTFEIVAGVGRYAIACLISQSPPFTIPAARFIVKQALGSEGTTEALQTEIKYLELLKGSPHIQQILGVEYPNPLGPFKVLTLFTDYAENGTIWHFIQRAQEKGERLPQRLLWRLFWCSLAWPNGEPKEVVRFGVEKSKLVHHGLNIDNVVIGVGDGAEHYLTPILKAVDLGLADDADPEYGPADKQNIFYIGAIMYALITLSSEQPISTLYFNINYFGQNVRVESHAAALVGPKYHWMDDDLRGAVAWCITRDDSERPTIENLARLVQHHAQHKTADVYANTADAAIETDEAIVAYARRLMVPQPEA
ncbi:hypothetical protein F4776DRAFT_659393 [Hypoxylon sp. NC0597]|nr:hypothetical protein F4776DRAFT_659393 [Hypoxylon sp. NC0597]